MTEIVAEIANSHQGSPKKAEKLALKSLDVGADAVKFQIYFADVCFDVCAYVYFEFNSIFST